MAAIGFLLLNGCIERIGNIKPKSPGSLKAFRIERSQNPSIDKDLVFTIYSNDNVTAYATAEYSLKGLKATFETEHGTLSVAGVEQKSGVTPNDYTNKVVYTLEGENGESRNFTVHLVPYTGLPVITITTNELKEIRDRENWLPARMTIDGMGQFEPFDDSLYVRGRGNGSWKFPKKPFNAKLYTKKQVLDMPKHKRWCFLANYRDRTLMRNDLTLKIGQMADGLEWTPNGEFAEVIFNGTHQGNFYLCEHIRVDKNRVKIDEMESTDTEGENLTGGYLLELDTYYDEINKFKTALNGWPVNLKSPDDDVCVPEQMNYIRNFYDRIEQLLHEGEYRTLYDSYIDADSFADYYLVQTLAGNTEIASIYSVFCYKKRGGKLYAGPLWDFDLSAFSKADGTTNTGTIWYKYLLKDPAFKSLLKERYALLKPKADAWAADFIRQRAAYLQKSAAVNWEKWEIDLKYLYNRLNGDETISFDAAIDRLVDMYEARSAMLEEFLANL